MVIWTIPLLIIIAIGAMTWISTHTLDPFRPLGRIAPNRPVPPDTKPLNVQVVALDWKWLFIYPDLRIAAVNEMAAPINVPISFKITSSSVWNTFYVPALAGMIYAMPGMACRVATPSARLEARTDRTRGGAGSRSCYSGTGARKLAYTFSRFWRVPARSGERALAPRSNRFGASPD